MGSKGARVTAHLSLPGRHLVLMPGTRHLGISRRIEDPEERDRLRAIVEAERPPDGGFIVRTACEGATARDIHDDIHFLTRLWARIGKTADTATAPALIHQDLDLVLRTVRDLFTGDVERLTVDAPADHARVLEFVEATMPRTGGARAPLPWRDAAVRAARHREQDRRARSIAGCGSSPAATSSSSRPSR